MKTETAPLQGHTLRFLSSASRERSTWLPRDPFHFLAAECNYIRCFKLRRAWRLPNELHLWPEYEWLLSYLAHNNSPVNHFTKLVIYKKEKKRSQWKGESFSELDFLPFYSSKLSFASQCLHWWSSVSLLVCSYRTCINTKFSEMILPGFLSGSSMVLATLESWKGTYLKI